LYLLVKFVANLQFLSFLSQIIHFNEEFNSIIHAILMYFLNLFALKVSQITGFDFIMHLESALVGVLVWLELCFLHRSVFLIFLHFTPLLQVLLVVIDSNILRILHTVTVHTFVIIYLKLLVFFNRVMLDGFECFWVI
jgi:hypothetical protein